LGISTTFGYQHYEENLGKQIPHFKRWNSMAPVWNNTDVGNDQLYPVYAAANRARVASPALRSSNRWFLDGNGNNPQILGVAKYQAANASPAFSDVMLAFANLNRDDIESDQFVIPGALAPLLGIKDGRTYNTRNLAAYTAQDATRDDVWLWGAGITGANLKSGGFFVSLNKVPASPPAWSTAPFEGQYLKLYDVTPPPSPAPMANYYEIGSSGAFTWMSNAGPDDNVTAWLVEVFDGDGDPVSSATVTSTQYTFNGTTGEIYRARITAISSAGISSSAPGQSDAGAPNSGSLTTALQLLSAAGDKDGDGESNADEQAAGTNPLSAASVFRVTAVSRNGGNVEVSFSSVTGFTYQLEASTTLAHGSWSDTGAPLDAVGASSMISVPAGGERRFFRVKVQGAE
jgi:hypothetical protein